MDTKSDSIAKIVDSVYQLRNIILNENTPKQLGRIFVLPERNF